LVSTQTLKKSVAVISNNRILSDQKISLQVESEATLF